MAASQSVVIVGAGLGGLSAAIHLRVAGFEVTLVEANERVGGRAGLIAREGYRFDVGPSLLNYPWVFEELFRTAGRNLHDRVELLPVDPSVTFRWPDGERLSLSSDISRLLEEFERVEPGSSARTVAFMRSSQAKYDVAFNRLVTQNEDRYLPWIRGVGIRELAGMGLGRSLDGELRRFFRSRRIREALGSYAMYLGGSPFELPGFFSILPYGELAYGLWLPKGGMYGLVQAIELLAQELGVHIRTRCRVSQIVVKGNQVQGVELEGGEFLASRCVISNVDAPTTDTELLAAPRLAGRAKGTRMTPGVLTFYWGIRGTLGGAAHHTIYLPDDYRATFEDLFTRRRMPEQLAFYVSIPSATDPGLAPPGCSAVFVLVPTPLISDMPEVDWAAFTAGVKRRVLERLEREGLRLAEERIEVEETYTPADWKAHFGLYDGSAFGAAHTLLQLGPRRSPNYRRDIRGLFYTGAGTTPGTGVPMVILSGKMTAERVQMSLHGADRSTHAAAAR
jgi:phytoene desaturase